MRSPPHCTSVNCQRIRIADFAYLLLFLPPHTCCTSERTSMIAQPTAPPSPTHPDASAPGRREARSHSTMLECNHNLTSSKSFASKQASHAATSFAPRVAPDPQILDI
jgi:hypothetical protein